MNRAALWLYDFCDRRERWHYRRSKVWCRRAVRIALWMNGRRGA